MKTPAIPSQVKDFFRRNKGVLCIQFGYRGKRGHGKITGLRMIAANGMPAEVEQGDIPAWLHEMVAQMTPDFLGNKLGCRGAGVVNRMGAVRLEHRSYYVESVDNVLEIQ